MKLHDLVLAAALVSTGACATIIQGSHQSVAVTSTPAGAAISVDGRPMGVTPSTLRLERKDSHVLRLALDGYQPYDMPLERKTSGWMWGNLVFGGVVGIVIDASTGAMYKLTPSTITTNLETRSAMIDGRRTIVVAVVMTPDPSWQKIGQLRAE